jgi:4-diphosphocytidyl-2-C-methyl-D-erythritol kinase
MHTNREAAPRATVTLRAPAKINLALEVVARLPNGYHGIRSIMLKLDRLVDTVRVRVDERGSGIAIHGDPARIPLDPTNLCHRAADAYLARTGKTARVDVTIEKRIPVAAGLGGGSSDAAAVLRALNECFDSALPHAELVALGADIGKDLPFFLGDARLARVSGMGERAEKLAAVPRLHCLLVNPGMAVATAEAYAALRRELWFMDMPGRHDRTAAMANALSSGDLSAIAAALYNDFEIVAERAHPVLKDLKQALLAFGARGALMSGSGPTLFGLFDADRPLANAEAALRAHYPAFVIARG